VLPSQPVAATADWAARQASQLVEQLPGRAAEANPLRVAKVLAQGYRMAAVLGAKDVMESAGFPGPDRAGFPSGRLTCPSQRCRAAFPGSRKMRASGPPPEKPAEYLFE
jgi:hypothetical protein